MLKRFHHFCGQAGSLPASHTVQAGKLTKVTDRPIASARLSDVWEGIYNDSRVAIKVLRLDEDDVVRKVRKVIPLEFSMSSFG